MTVLAGLRCSHRACLQRSFTSCRGIQYVIGTMPSEYPNDMGYQISDMITPTCLQIMFMVMKQAGRQAGKQASKPAGQQAGREASRETGKASQGKASKKHFPRHVSETGISLSGIILYYNPKRRKWSRSPCLALGAAPSIFAAQSLFAGCLISALYFSRGMK